MDPLDQSELCFSDSEDLKDQNIKNDFFRENNYCFEPLDYEKFHTHLIKKNEKVFTIFFGDEQWEIFAKVQKELK